MKTKKRFTIFVSRIIVLCIFAIPVKAISATLYVATNGSNTSPYNTWEKATTKIQTAIDYASAGDIIIVGSNNTGHGTGIYNENVNVTKILTIKSESGYTTTTVAAADTSDHVFEVQADNVTIGGEGCGFSIYGATGNDRAGIYLSGRTACIIQDNRCGWDSDHKSYYGICLIFSSSNNTLTGNTCNSNSYGILLSSSSNNTLMDNTCNSNIYDGIILFSSSNNTLTGNTCNSNYDGIYLITSSANTLTGNICGENGEGICLFSSCNNNTLTGNTCDSNGYEGIYLCSSSNNNTLTGNTCNSNLYCGIYLSSSSDNTLNGNTCQSSSYYGIYLYLSSTNTLTGNTCNSNSDYGIYLSSSSNNTLTGNTCNSNEDGIDLYSSSSNTLTGNTCNSNTGMGIGIWLSDSDSNTLTGNTANENSNIGIWLSDSDSNTLTSNTCNSNSENGIYMEQSSSNTIYLNNLFDNPSRNAYVESGSGNIWYSPTTIYYDYTSGSFHKNYLGNYYSNYTGSDTDGDGIGTDPYNGTDMTDNYPLMTTSNHYSLQAWWLNSDSKMYIDDRSKSQDSVTISSRSSHIWIADQATLQEISFSGYDTWTGQMVFTSALANGHTFKVEIGSSTDGSDFTPGGAEATITGTGSATVFTYETNTSAFGVATGEYLAFRITNNSGVSYIVEVGGAGSYCSSPNGSGDYLVIDKLNAFTEYSLRQNYPNPFSTSTLIHYELPERTNVILKVYDVFGREVSTLFEGEQNGGKYEVEFNGVNLPSGIYFYQLQAGDFKQVKKLLFK